jgi:hypothetical protein
MWQIEQTCFLTEEIGIIVSSLPEELCGLIKEPLTVTGGD